MIPMANILEWRAAHPWQTLSQTPLEKPFERKVSGFRFRVSGI